LTKHDAPSAAVMPAGSGRQSPALMTRYCADHGDRLADQRLRSTRRAGLFLRCRPLIADGQGFVEPPRRRPQRGLGDVSLDGNVVACAGQCPLGHASRANQNSPVGWIDRRRLNPHNDLIVGQFGTSTRASEISNSPLALMSERSFSLERFQRSGYRFLWRKRVKTKNRAHSDSIGMEEALASRARRVIMDGDDNRSP